MSRYRVGIIHRYLENLCDSDVMSIYITYIDISGRIYLFKQGTFVVWPVGVKYRVDGSF